MPPKRPRPTMSAASGRSSLALTREGDWEDVVRAVHSLPDNAREWGMDKAVAWGRTQLRSLVDLVALSEPRTKEEAKAIRRVHMYLTVGILRSMSRDTPASLAIRTEFLEAIENVLLAPTYKLVFSRSGADSGEEPYEPILGEDA